MNGTIAILIPAFRPGGALSALVDELTAHFAVIVIVDDGSGPEFRPLFDALEARPHIRVLRHAVNLGKGAALKTGLNHFLCHCDGYSGVVTADADGQHTPEDILRVAQESTAHPDNLILGTRQFTGRVPLRSRLGNQITRVVLRAVSGQDLADTQTGLRGIPRVQIPAYLRLQSSGYDFELDMLIAAREHSFPVRQEPIGTIYRDGNRSSHFNPLIDSMKIYFVLLRFCSTSLITALIDNLVFLIAFHSLSNLLYSQVLGRAVAMLFNYFMVRRAVFRSSKTHSGALPKYLMLVLCSGAVSYACIRLLVSSFAISTIGAKLAVESLLFLANFAIQRDLIFDERAPAAKTWFSPRAVVFGVVLLAMVALEVHGFYAGDLFGQHIWDPDGRLKFFRFTAIFFGISVLLALLFPKQAGRVWIAAGIAFGIAAAGIGAVAAVCLILFSCYVLGTALRPKASDSAIDQLLNALLGVGVFGLVMEGLIRLPVNYWFVYLALFLLPLLGFFRTSLACARRVSGIAFQPISPSWMLVAYPLFAHLLVAVKPEVGADGLAMHLAIPTYIAQHHQWHFDVLRSIWAVMPMRADWFFTAAYMLGGELAAKLISFGFLLLTAGLLSAAARRWISPRCAMPAVAIFVSTPLVMLVTGSLFVENALVALLLGAAVSLWLFRESGQGLLLFFVLCGAAMGTKFGAFAFLAALAPVALMALWKQSTTKPVLLGMSLLAAFAAPAYVTAWRLTGNPIFPFSSSRFPEHLLRHRLEDPYTTFHAPVFWRTAYDLTFHSNICLPGQPGAAGFLYLLLLPLAVLALFWRKNAVAASALVAALFHTVLVMRFQPDLRYLYPTLPLYALACAWALEQAWRENRALRLSLGTVFVAGIALNTYFLPSSGWYHKSFYLTPLIKPAGADWYIRQSAPQRRIVEYFNRVHPGETVAYLEGNVIAGLQGRAYTMSWHNWDYYKDAHEAHSAADMAALVHQLGVKYVLTPNPNSPVPLSPVLRGFRDQYLDLEYCFGQACAARLIPVTGEVLASREEVLASREYDDFDPRIRYSSNWLSGEFPLAFRGTVTYSAQPGAMIEVRFAGSEVVYVGTRAPNRGIAAIQVDDDPPLYVSYYSPAVQWQAPFVIKAHSNGVHRLTIRVTGRKDPRATDCHVDLDELIVR